LNLGSPDSPSVHDVRRYLREFLMDPRVLDTNWFVRFCVVHFAILPFRPKQSAHAYQTIWTPEGSPLIVISRRLQENVQHLVDVPVHLAMRYQNPSIEAAIKEIARGGATNLLLVPLFPHYAMSSFETAVERVKEVAGRIATGLNITVQRPYYDHPGYLQALVASAASYLEKPYDHLLFSFHGIPERQVRKTDPTGRHCLASPNCCDTPSPAHEVCYRAQCIKTAKAFASSAAIPNTKWSVAFQSRLGRDPWLTPYTDKRIVELAESGIKRLLVICPAFVSDCLETIEEIGMRGRESFLASGGQQFDLIPCLNTNPAWTQTLAEMIKQFSSQTKLQAEGASR
jgi:protoporphyrin/coproporphyrin ferrochelatase